MGKLEEGRTDVSQVVKERLGASKSVVASFDGFSVNRGGKWSWRWLWVVDGGWL